MDSGGHIDLAKMGKLTRVGDVAFYGMPRETDSSRKVVEVVIESQGVSQLSLACIEIFPIEYRLSEVPELSEKAGGDEIQ